MTDEEVKHYDDKWKRLDAEIATLRAEVDRLTEINADAVIRLDDRLLRAEKAEAALAEHGMHRKCQAWKGRKNEHEFCTCGYSRALRDAKGEG